jgi:mannose-1-phosphate guanylyltransferase/mannose-6-phosphate isomerase
MTKITPVILCGGSGSRLWPLSRTGFPKQFLCLTNTYSLFQQATKRLTELDSKLVQVSQPIIVTGEEHRFLASEQMREVEISLSAMILEPEARNTAPALTLAALSSVEDGEDPVLVVTPADQTILDQKAFSDALLTAIESAAKGNIVIMGVTPDRPETGFGYILIDNNHKEKKEASIANVKSFVEKPSINNAQKYMEDGRYFWNSGMFVLKASVWLKIISEFRLDILKGVTEAWSTRSVDANFIRPGSTEFSNTPSESIDYAVMEKCPGSTYPIKMVQLNAGWDDLGAWDSVWKVLEKDDKGNVNNGDVLHTSSKNNLVHATSRLVSMVGVEDLIVIETPDAVLVANKKNSQEVKIIVNKLEQEKRYEHIEHRKVHRPWGWYDSIDEGARFKVKRIHVNPKASLSLQKHNHRAEHWIVVSGTAEITNGTKTFILTENQSTYIPLGEIHRLANPEMTPLEIIEVQSGMYLGEDDIIRIEDIYGR